MRSRHVILIAPSNARAETPTQGATPKPKLTQGGDLGVCTQPTPQPRPIPHILIYPLRRDPMTTKGVSATANKYRISKHK
ncbi:hypothetical protein HanIR_Chr13g0632361 [Helianthus annuus]|nr:hypothetical protein HanIR_Chr13g0632361 [Helianthus annuus]